MTHATRLWSVWQGLLQPFAWAFSRRGYRRFAEWITALAISELRGWSERRVR
jgi:hypothetical protein